MFNKPKETHAEKMKRYQQERDEWKWKPTEREHHLTQEQKERYWKERKIWGLSDL